MQMANIVPACLLGCDELFEHGHVYVTPAGVIAVNTKAVTTPDLAAAAEALEGLLVPDHGSHREPYFAWHRTYTAN
ncbi:hypothetical protein QF037_009985 [Streptomyces canus]|uniref:hypothetical protein n=1 Tax=Streptomyces canus TaxID=58343 RepID=UPI00278926E0|nr:hypothetical protein [Streptomyces canus]MDQ0605552.1 hypothetical protein [Streptomyces canus]